MTKNKNASPSSQLHHFASTFKQVRIIRLYTLKNIYNVADKILFTMLTNSTEDVIYAAAISQVFFWFFSIKTKKNWTGVACAQKRTMYLWCPRIHKPVLFFFKSFFLLFWAAFLISDVKLFAFCAFRGPNWSSGTFGGFFCLFGCGTYFLKNVYL